MEEVHVADEWAFERGTYTVTFTPKGTMLTVQDVGKYLTIYQRQADGAWKMARDIWNSNTPLPATPSH